MTANTGVHTCSYYCERPECVRRQRDELRDRMAAAPTQQPAAPSGAVNVVGMPEFDDLMDHIYEYGTTAEGVVERANAFARAVLAQYAPQQPAAVGMTKRELFTIAAMHTLRAGDYAKWEHLAQDAVSLADATLAALAAQQQEARNG